jgi:putative peptidoglycan lipid II flippase
LAEGDEEEADRVAGSVGAILALTSTAIVLVGVLATPYLIPLIAGGYVGAKRELIIHLVRILFPGAGILVCSAWCLGILNSHRRFFLSYTAPVVWNLAMIGTLLAFRHQALRDLAVTLAWGTGVGCVLQFAVQLPLVLRLTHNLRFRPEVHSAHVREVLRNFLPVSVSRGVVQISAYVDQLLATHCGEGALAAMTNAQSMYTLPVSLFGMAVSAAELPAMSATLGTDKEVQAILRRRLDSGLRQIAFLIVPSAMAFFALGDVITAALYQRGEFNHSNSIYVWRILAGSGIGLLASTLGRLYASTYYALRDTRTPLLYAILRVALTVSLGYLCALPVPRWLGIDPHWGAVGLTATAGMAGWVEFTLLRRTLNRRIGVTGVPAGLVAKLWAAAALGAAVAWSVKFALGPHHRPILLAIPVLGVYGIVYFAVTHALQVPECAGAFQKLLRLRR